MSSPNLSAENFRRTLSNLITVDNVALVIDLWKLVARFLPASYQGLYEVSEYDAELEICDPQGRVAIYRKRSKVTYLQNQVFSYRDMAWGDGEIFADYECSPGIAVDRFQEGHRWHVLISLRETRNRGDKEEILIKRTIRDGFTKPSESFQVEVNHEMSELTASIIFPAERLPRRVTLIEQNRNRTTQLGAEHSIDLPDGRQQIRWHTDQPRLFEAYILRWQW